MNKLIPVLLMLPLFTPAVFAQDPAQPDRVVVYKSVEGVELNLHVFEPEGYDPKTDQRPAIVFFFGGGWMNGSAQQFFRQSRYFADRGMVAMSADYRVFRQHNTRPSVCVQDGKSAMRWIRAHAKELGIDPEKIAAGGGSAGGHVAAATALFDEFNEPGEDTSVSARPDALVLFNPVLDTSEEGFGYKQVKAYWEAFSPLHQVGESAPPTLVMLGTADRLIPVATAEAFRDKMKAAGVRSELVLYPDQGHGFFNGARFRETLQAADAFLVSLGWIE
ncbi:MAG: alpha/beta hydrolase [Kiritimatiellia bacterium]